MDLFAGGLPSHWEIIGVDLRMWDFYQNASAGSWSAAGSARVRAAPGR